MGRETEQAVRTGQNAMDTEASERDMEGQNNPVLAQRGRAAGNQSNSRDEQAKYRPTCDPIPQDFAPILSKLPLLERYRNTEGAP